MLKCKVLLFVGNWGRDIRSKWKGEITEESEEILLAHK